MKRTFSLILSLFIFISCTSKKTEKIKTSFKDTFEEVYSFEIPDTIGPTIIVQSLDIVEDKYIYFTEQTTSSLYKVDLKKKTMQRISRFGSGPGEFQRPGTVLYENDSLYVGNSNPFLNILNKEGEHLKEIKMVGYRNFIKHKSGYYKYSGEPTDYYFYSDKKGETIKEKGKIGKRPLFLKYANPSPNFTGLFEDKDMMYFMNSYEAKVFRYNLTTFEMEEAIKLKGFIDQSWDKYYEVKIDPAMITAKAADQHFFWKFDKFILNNELHFYIRAKDPKTEKVDQFIVNQSGEIVLKLETKSHENYYFKKSYDDKSIFTLHDSKADVYYLKIFKGSSLVR